MIYIIKETLETNRISYLFFSGGKWREDYLNPTKRLKKLIKKRGTNKTLFGYKCLGFKTFIELKVSSVGINQEINYSEVVTY